MTSESPITKEQARAAVLEEINPPPRPDPYPDVPPPMPQHPECVILDEHTIEREWGWVFFYTAKRIVEKDHPLLRLAGNGPIAVEKATAKLTHLWSGNDPEDEIRMFEEENGFDAG